MVGFVIPVILWFLSPLFHLDPTMPPFFIVWPTVVIMLGTAGNTDLKVALLFLGISASVNALIYMVVGAVFWLISMRLPKDENSRWPG